MSTKDHWYAVHLGTGRDAPHAGFYHVKEERDEAGHRVLNYQIAFKGELDGRQLDHEAACRIVLERREGRFAPLEIEYHEPSHAAKMTFRDSHLHGTGAAAGHDGVSLPDDVIPTHAIALLAEGIYNQREASLQFSAIAEGTGAICASEARLVGRGKTDEMPFKTIEELWRVDWLSHEGILSQSFYFNDEGLLMQADWGGSTARLVTNPQDAVPEGFSVPKSLHGPSVK